MRRPMSRPATAVTNSAVDRSWTPRTRRAAGTIVRYGRIEKPTTTQATTQAAMNAPLVEVSATLDEAFALLSGGAAALVAVRGDHPVGVVTKLDVLEYLAHRPRTT